MNAYHWLFWLSVVCVAYTFVGYPATLAIRAKLRPRRVQRAPYRGSFSIVLAARNEEDAVARRIEELCGHIEASGLDGELIVVSDGSTDRTADLARRYESDHPVRVLELPERLGKAAALTQACELAHGEILVFADARQSWEAGAIAKMLENFADPGVGGVSGDLVLASGQGLLEGVGIYWRIEKWMRRKESLVNSLVGATGAISAVRRCLFRPIPAGTLLDDVYWSLQVSLQGYRVVHDERARAFDRLPECPAAEMRRKVRTLAGNYQLAAQLPGALIPWRNPVWGAWLSHKLLRLVAPWALLAALVASALVPDPFFRLAFLAQLWAYSVGLVGLTRMGKQSRVLAAAGSFLVLNSAAWLAFWAWISGRAQQTWTKTRYDEPATPQPIAPVSAGTGALP
jgi:cellulose synthase/poly-beta-1,6-N-acetylglucosamine synthase-like glycosyltransferase